MRTVPILPVLLLALASLPALEWNCLGRGVPLPPGLVLARDPASSATAARYDSGVEIQVEQGRWAALERKLDGTVATDERPLRCYAQVLPGRASPIFALVWDEQNSFAISVDRGRRRALAHWLVKGQPGQAGIDISWGQQGQPQHLRLVVTGRDLSAWVSADGWTWRRLAALPRSDGLELPPRRLLLGSGRLAPGATSLAAVDPGQPGVPTLLRAPWWELSDGPPAQDPEWLKRYTKGDSVIETIRLASLEGLVKEWKVAGPFDRNATPPPAAVPAEDWKPVQADAQGLVLLDRLLPGDGKDEVRWAVATVQAKEAGLVRLAVTGERLIRVLVNGRPAGGTPEDRPGASFDLVVPFNAGPNELAFWGLADRGRSHSYVSARVQPADPLRESALLRRVALDFPDDAESAQLPILAARLAEQAGFQRYAAGLLGELVASADSDPATVERATIERARLYRLLRDRAGVAADVETLTRRWAESAGGRLEALRKTVSFWLRLEEGVRAREALDLALGLEGLSVADRIDLLRQRALLRQQLGDAQGATDDLAAMAAALPVRDPLRGQLQAELLVRRVATGAAPSAALAQAGGEDPRLVRLAAAMLPASDPARLKALERAAATGTVEDQVAYAEMLAAKDPRQAAQRLRSLLGTPPGPGEELPRLRQLLFRQLLRSSPAGERLESGLAAGGPSSGAIRRWWLCGPFDDRKAKAWESPPVKPDKADPRQPVQGAAWLAPESDQVREAWNDDVLDLVKVFGDQKDVVCLALTEIVSDLDRQALLQLGSDDGCMVWLNGRKLFEERAARGLARNQGQVTLPLVKGTNRLLVMVQQVGGAWMLQASLRSEPWPASQLATIDQLLGARPERRDEALRELLRTAVECAQAGQGEQAAVLARCAGALFGDRIGSASDLVRSLLAGDLGGMPLGVVVDLIDRLDAALAARQVQEKDNADRLRSERVALRLQFADRLSQAGEVAAIDRIRAVLHCFPEPEIQSRARSALAEAYRRAGFLSLSSLAQEIELPSVAAQRQQQAQAQGRAKRSKRSARTSLDDALVADSYPLGVRAEAAERQLLGGDEASGVSTLRDLVVEGHGQVFLAHGSFLGAAHWAAERLRTLSGPAAAAWRELGEGPAAALLPGATSLAAQERLASAWPGTVAAAEALARAGQRYRDAGAPRLAEATWRLAAGVAGSDAAARLKDQLARLPQAVPLPMPRTESLQALVHYPVPVSDLAHARSIVGESHALHLPALFGGSLALHTLEEVLLYDLPGGRLRWRSSAPASGLRPTGRNHPFQGLVETWTGIDAERVVARTWRDRLASLDCFAREDGRLRWSSAGEPVLAGLSAWSSPALVEGRVYGLFGAGQRLVMACLDAADGQVLWTAPLPVAALGPEIDRVKEAGLSAQGAPPLVEGRGVFLCTDAGAVVALDHATGRLLWIGTYPRAVMMQGDCEGSAARLLARPASRLALAGGVVVAVPRDSLGIYAFAVQDGEMRWSRESVDARLLLGAAPVDGQAALLVQGLGVECLSAADGATIWRWHGDGPVRGRGCLTADGLLVATTAGIQRLGLDGRSAGHLPWPGGVPLSGLVAVENRLACAGQGTVTVLGPGQKAAGPIATPSLGERDLPLTPLLSPGSGPLAAQLRLGGDGCRRLVAPPQGAPGEAYALGDRSLARLDTVTGRMLWRVAVPDEPASLSLLERTAVVRCGDSLTGFARASGELRWLHPLGTRLVADSSSWTGITPDGVVLVAALARRSALVLGEDDGRILGNVEFSGDLRAAFRAGQEVHGVVAPQRQEARIEVRDLASGRLLASHALGTRSGVSCHLLPQLRGLVVAVDEGKALLWRAGAAKPISIDLPKIEGRGKKSSHWSESDGRVTGWIGTNEGGVSMVCDPVTGKVLVQVPGGEEGSFRVQGTQALRLAVGGESKRKDKGKGRKSEKGEKEPEDEDGLQSFDLERKGQRQWTSDRPDGRYLSTCLGSGRGVVLTDGGMRVVVGAVDLATGKPVAEGALPMQPRHGQPSLLLGDRLLVGGPGGVMLAGPRSASAARSVETPILPRLAVQVDGLLDEWQAVPALGEGGAVRLACDEANLYLAVTVPETPWEGGAGEGLVLASCSNVRPQHWESVGEWFAYRLGQRSGLPLAEPLQGAIPVPPEGQAPTRIELRIATTSRGTVYEAAVPWNWLRLRYESLLRTGQGGLALALSSGGRLRPLFGDGLAGGADRLLFQPIRAGK